jgi:hypothetical protein
MPQWRLQAFIRKTDRFGSKHVIAVLRKRVRSPESGNLCMCKHPLPPDRTFFARFRGLVCQASISRALLDGRRERRSEDEDDPGAHPELCSDEISS